MKKYENIKDYLLRQIEGLEEKNESLDKLVNQLRAENDYLRSRNIAWENALKAEQDAFDRFKKSVKPEILTTESGNTFISFEPVDETHDPDEFHNIVVECGLGIDFPKPSSDETDTEEDEVSADVE